METSIDPNLKPNHHLPADDDQLDLYTIPSHSSWFSWDDINEVEKLSLKEFFDGSSITRSPKIYREYRDFIISKYREDPSRRLTFTEVRKSLVGDLTLLQKVFLFLEKWGLINFGAPVPVEDWTGRWNVKVEDGAPQGVRVVAVPGSLKPVSVPPVVSGGSYNGDVVDNGFQLPPLSSYSDVYSQKKGLICRNCKEHCDSGHYEYTKETSYTICVKCFESKNYGENRSVDDFKLIEHIPNNSAWTEGETLLLLESVLKHGDDWDLVSQTVQTKTKLDCISKLIELPFGELMLGSLQNKVQLLVASNNTSEVKKLETASSQPRGSTKLEDRKQNGDSESQGPPLKRPRNTPISDASSSLMKEVAFISSMVGPHIKASASEAAVAAICHENACPLEIFEGVDVLGTELGSLPPNSIEDSVVEERSTLVKDSAVEEPQSEPVGATEGEEIPLTLRVRAVTATALGAAAAHAKLLADEEDRQIQHLVTTMIESHLKKLKLKLKSVEELEVIMEKERLQMEKVESSILDERANVLQKIFNLGISRWRDPAPVKISN